VGFLFAAKRGFACLKETHVIKSWLLRPLYEEDDPSHGGEVADKPRTSDVLDRYGRDALKLAEKLSEALTDNYSLREKNRTLRAEKSALEKTQAPEGSTILTGADAAAWQAYKALGAPDALKKSLDEAQTATQEAQTLRREKAVNEAANVAGFKPGVLARLADGLELTIKGEKDKKAAYVVKDGAETALEDYAIQEWAEFLPALKQADKQADRPAPHDINGSNRGGSNGLVLTDDDRRRATELARRTF
jgi:hypothetical protein